MMTIERWNLRDDGSAYMMAYIQDVNPEVLISKQRPAVVVCPGGGYEFCSDREAEPVAFEYMAKGFQPFVVRYSVGEHSAYPNSLVDLSRAIKIIREHAEAWHVIPDQIAVCGFSAGGHLVSSLGTLWNDPEVMEKSCCLQGENEPNALVMVYPVVTMTEYTHRGSREALLRGCPEHQRESLIQKLSNEKNVGVHTPPAFLCHTFMDDCVPVENSLMFGKAMAEKNRLFEMHIFTKGHHGLSLANEEVFCDMSLMDRDFAAWFQLSVNWLYNLFGISGILDMEPVKLNPENRAGRVSD